MSAIPATSSPGPLGRCFVHPAFDFLLIGGGLSLIVIPAVYFFRGDSTVFDYSMLPWIILLSNSAHFAASSVRLYTKPGAKRALPLLTMAFPAIMLCLLTLCIVEADRLGRWFQLLYLSWSPFHYAAQAYGLAVMYSYRSGCVLSLRDKRLIWWISLLPFFKVLLISLSKHAVPWIVPAKLLWSYGDWRIAVGVSANVLGGLALLMPFVWFVVVRRSTGRSLPLISLLVIVTNAVWFTLFELVDGFVWATVFHGVQYMTIASVFYVRERVVQPDNRRGVTYHAAWFYGVSIALGYALFNCLPYGYTMLGFGTAESVLMVIAAINIHHFVVDAYIWKLGRGDANRRVVEGAAAGT